jgi:hypothetical protein
MYIHRAIQPKSSKILLDILLINIKCALIEITTDSFNNADAETIIGKIDNIV